MRPMTEGICRLCSSYGELCDSHLIPKGAVKRYNRTAPTGASRNVLTPNVRTQDYLHKPLLCRDCEDRFERRETYWAREVDHTVEEQLPRSFVCTEDHRYFAASLVWRIIVWDIPESPTSPFSREERLRIRLAERRLRRYLLDKTPYPNPSVPWLHLLTPPHGFTGADTPEGLNVYLRGSLDVALNAHGDSLYCYASIGGYLVVGVLAVGSAVITWTFGTALKPGATVEQDPYRFPRDPDFRSILAERAGAVGRIPLSARQQSSVNSRVDAVPQANLRTNPHMIATLVDYQNMKQRADRG